MSAMPFAPNALKPFFRRSGGGGAMVLLQTHPDPTCAAKVDTRKGQRRVYREWYRRATG